MVFEKEELQKMRILYNPGLTLLGFRSSKAVKACLSVPVRIALTPLGVSPSQTLIIFVSR